MDKEYPDFDPKSSDIIRVASCSSSGHVNERSLMRKVDLRVVPVLCVLYTMTFLDRVNIGNASIFGLKSDLGLEGNQYNTALVIFFVPYILLEIPSNMMLKRFRPHVWLSLCMFFFGLTTTLQGLVQSYSGLLAARFFLGAFEAGMLAGCYYIIAMWYKRCEAQKRFTFLFSASTFAGAFGGLLASAIGNMDGVRGYSAWRWIFILEGILTCVIAAFSFPSISDFPHEVKWLSEQEKEMINVRLLEDVGDPKAQESLTLSVILAVLKDYTIVMGGFMYMGLIMPGYSIAYFSPMIIQSLGYGNIATQLHSVPPYACAFVFGMVVAVASDRMKHRYAFAMLSSCIALAGFIILFVVHDNNHLQYGAIFMATIGIYTAMPVVLCWFDMNLAGHHRRSVGTAFQVAFGSIGGIVSTFSFIAKDAPDYIPGYSVCIAFLAISMAASTAYFICITLKNRSRDLAHAPHTTTAIADTGALGDLDPNYRYLQ